MLDLILSSQKHVSAECNFVIYRRANAASFLFFFWIVRRFRLNWINFKLKSYYFCLIDIVAGELENIQQTSKNESNEMVFSFVVNIIFLMNSYACRIQRMWVISNKKVKNRPEKKFPIKIVPQIIYIPTQTTELKLREVKFMFSLKLHVCWTSSW